MLNNFVDVHNEIDEKLSDEDDQKDMHKKDFPHFSPENYEILDEVPQDEPLPEPESEEDHDLSIAIEFIIRKKKSDKQQKMIVHQKARSVSKPIPE